ncbi:glycoside hydrolase family 2 protein [Polaribacter staleyi]|uniref:glycoside hydrolase family 2 protein n=1 Tax=Polaribacter staleyi TaxID=2022337 RepID=UPI0031BB2937
MIKLNKVVIVVILLLSISIKAQVTFLKHRNQIEISDWKFKKGVIYNAHQNEFDSSSWESVSVPHTYSMDAINEVAYDKVKAWYRSEFTTKKTTDERTFIRFEAVGQEAKIYVNGKYIGQHIGGYSAFCFDITDAITSGRNLLAVQVSNAPNFKRIPVTDGLFNLYGGIYRNVTLFKTPVNHIKPDFHASSGVFVTLKSIDKSAEIAVKTLLNLDKKNKQPITIHYVIKDAKRNVILNKSQKIHQKNEIKETLIIPKPHLWQGKQDPYIYTLEVSLISDKSTDKIVQTFGLRNYKVDPNTGFHLNGKPYRSYGVSMHQEWKQVGPALTKENHEKDFELIDEIGATALRMSHYQHSDYSYELADKIGLLVWSEIPFVHDYSGREQQNAKQQLTELIFQNYNHPSIVYWGLWNEVRAYRSPDEPCVLLTKELNKLAHQLDSTRITASASDRPDISNMGNITDMQAWNKYYGWYYGAYEDMATWLDTAHKNYPDRHLGISEYGVGGNPMQQNASRVEKSP